MIKVAKFVQLDPAESMTMQIAKGISSVASEGLIVHAAVCSRKIVEAVEDDRAFGHFETYQGTESSNLTNFILSIDPPTLDEEHPSFFGVMYGMSLYRQGNVPPTLELPGYSCILYGRELQ